jgi:hypothetical protein
LSSEPIVILSAEALALQRVRSRKLRILAVLCVAFVGRSLVILYVLVGMPAGWLFTRGVEMRLLAESLLRGQGFSSPFGINTGPTALIAPLYPLLVAMFFKLCGDATTATAFVIMALQMVVNVATIWLMILLASRFAGERTALCVGMFWACSLPLVWMPTIFWETCFSTFAVTLFAALALCLRREAGWLTWMMWGVALGVAALMNPALAPCLLALMLVAAARAGGRCYSRALVGLMLAAAVFSPWPIRNARVFHALILTRTTYGYELWMGNHEGATGYLEERLFPMYNSAELTDYRSRGELDYAAEKLSVAVRYIRLHPMIFVQRTAIRVVRFWTGEGNRSGSVFFVLHGTSTAVLGFSGLFVLFRKRQWYELLVFVIPLALFPLPYYITHAEFRYRLVIDPLMTVLAAVAVGFFFGGFLHEERAEHGRAISVG